MTYKEKPIQKKYFTISEIAKLCNVYSSKIKHWEKVLEINIERKMHNGKFQRVYTHKDILLFQAIANFSLRGNLTLQGIKNLVVPRMNEILKRK